MQISGKGKALSLKMQVIAGAMILGTPHKNKFSIDYLWRRTRLDHPTLINPSRAINSEDRCVDWLVHRNIIKWNFCAKDFLAKIKMGKDEPGLIHKHKYSCCFDFN